jgi:hypothetical protein
MPVQLIDPGRCVRFSQKPITEKIQGLNTVGDAVGKQTLVKSVFAM